MVSVDSETNARATVLAVDDNPEGLFALATVLESAGFRVLTASTGQQTLAQARSELPDLILLDVNMPGPDGFEVAKELRRDSRLDRTPIILLTALNSLDDVTKGFASGADDYIKKPYHSAELLARVEAGLRMQRVYRELHETRERSKELSQQLATQRGFGQLVGKSAAMAQVFDLIERIRSVEVPVLITGESGTGKELVARAVHASSPRASGPLVIQNCSAFSENLLESELFGHVRGAFTGAVRDKRGLFEEAHRGTFFLDEMGEMGLALQARLLRVLQDGTFTAVGDTKMKRTDVRIVAATNRSLEQMIRDGTFREDLYYRINVINIHLPPLRERRSDIGLLVDHFMDRHRASGRAVGDLSTAARESLMAYDWPGNVRQLQNEVERFLIMAGPHEVIQPEHLSPQVRGRAAAVPAQQPPEIPEGTNLKDAIVALEKRLISSSLKARGGNKSDSARELGISRSSLIAKVKEYKLED